MNFSLNLLGSELWGEVVSSLTNLWQSTGLYDLVANFTTGGWQNLVMIAIACLLVYLAVVKKFEPLLLLPIAFGMFIINIPGAYRILFGTKGYIVTDNLAGIEVARGTAEELMKFFGQNDLATLFDMAGETPTNLSLIAVSASGAEYAVGQLTISSQTVIRDFGLFYYIYKGVDW
ncbi:MAG: sodium ion-translocating decarboxylase subunit beta, partial [Clostridia bacterium]|nr:sodium ion-translocating decarboxylase subunit beta [Clostridia bacterium]